MIKKMPRFGPRCELLNRRSKDQFVKLGSKIRQYRRNSSIVMTILSHGLLTRSEISARTFGSRRSPSDLSQVVTDRRRSIEINRSFEGWKPVIPNSDRLIVENDFRMAGYGKVGRDSHISWFLLYNSNRRLILERSAQCYMKRLAHLICEFAFPTLPLNNEINEIFEI
jgi:hypothetical protein